METQEIINAISSVGFPIVACGALFWMINTSMKEMTDAINKLSNSIDNASNKEGVNIG